MKQRTGYLEFGDSAPVLRQPIKTFPNAAIRIEPRKYKQYPENKKANKDLGVW